MKRDFITYKWLFHRFNQTGLSLILSCLIGTVAVAQDQNLAGEGNLAAQNTGVAINGAVDDSNLNSNTNTLVNGGNTNTNCRDSTQSGPTGLPSV